MALPSGLQLGALGGPSTFGAQAAQRLKELYPEFAEIVYYALDDDEDLIARSPAAVGVFYTKRGRIVAGPSVSPAGQLWTTLKAGSDHAISQAIGQLVELSGGRWGDF